MRLVGGSATQGRVQLLHGGNWVNVSMVEHPGLAVAVVCRQLGFAGGVAADPPRPDVQRRCECWGSCISRTSAGGPLAGPFAWHGGREW